MSNKVLTLKGDFGHYSPNAGGTISIPKSEDASVSSSKIIRLANELTQILQKWTGGEFGVDPLVSAYYMRTLAKSNRIQALIKEPSKASSDSIVGSRFWDVENKNHVITYLITSESLQQNIDTLHDVAQVLDSSFNGGISSEELDSFYRAKANKNLSGLSKSKFAQIIKDAYYIDHFGIDESARELQVNEETIVSLFDVNQSTETILKKLDINVSKNAFFKDSVLLNAEQYRELVEKAPYLVSMVSDIAQDEPLPFTGDAEKADFEIRNPTESDPVVGVIDTGFSDDLYLSNWVKVVNLLPEGLSELDEKDKEHGTAVSSLIVDGPRFNPELEDGCGVFRIRHFVVANHEGNSTFSIMDYIKRIVNENPEIKVWNISLGSIYEVNHNSVSLEASLLDQIQFDRTDLIFVVAGTNDSNNQRNKRVGAPADSVNSLVVNAVDLNGEIPKYARKGPILSFYRKPDVSYFGGDESHGINVLYPGNLIRKSSGTSLAAPLITRKIAFLIYKMDLNREEAKALLIHAATGWQSLYQRDYLGYGIVPKHINDVLSTPKDETRFVITDHLKGYETSTFNLPLPVINNKFPFVVKATLCYFPACSRKQGVDYASSEVSFRIGRVREVIKKNSKGEEEKKIEIKPINNDMQDKSGEHTTEEKARDAFRKWDNIKFIGELFSENARPRKTYNDDRWGIALNVKERSESKRCGQGMRFALVVSIKTLDGKNYYNDFVRRVSSRGWIVQPIDIEQRLNIYNEAEIDITFDE